MGNSAKHRARNLYRDRITAGATMPNLVVLCPPCETVAYRVVLSPIPGNDDDVCSTETFVPPHTETTWNITATMLAVKGADYVQGGDGVVYARIDGSSVERELPFIIRGTQPSGSAVRAEINGLGSNWFLWPVAQHESGPRQFRDEAGLPLKSGDNGFGIYQLTNTPRPTCNQVWSWRQNVQAGVRKLLGIRSGYATNWMRRQRRQAVEDTGEVSN